MESLWAHMNSGNSFMRTVSDAADMSDRQIVELRRQVAIAVRNSLIQSGTTVVEDYDPARPATPSPCRLEG